MLLNRETSQFMIIDVQEKLMPSIFDTEKLIKNITMLIKVAKRLAVPTLVTEQYPQGLGGTTTPLKEELGNEFNLLEKDTFSAMKDEEINNAVGELRTKGKSQVIVCGIEAHVCVMQSALDMRAQDYDVFVVGDAISSREPDSHRMGIERMQQAGVNIVSSEMVMFELLENSKCQEFKDLRGLLL